MQESVNNLAGTGRGWLTTVAGIILALAGLAGSITLVRVVTHLLMGEYAFLSTLVIYQTVWLVIFASLFITGLSLVISGVKRKKHDIVPGPTLYILGLALVVNGFFLLIYSQTLYAVVAIAIGAILIYLEWATHTA